MRRGTAAATAVAALAGSILLAACEHSPPGAVEATRLGPYDTLIPRRLTFSTQDDATPSVSGDVIVYARQGTAYPDPQYSPLGREECLAFLPLEGGTIERQYCPHDLLPSTDPYVNTWTEPSLSPDGTRLAFTWQRGPQFGPNGFDYAWLMVTAADRPQDTTAVHRFVTYSDSGTPPRRADLATRITWVGDDRLRFLANQEVIGWIDPAQPGRGLDTTFIPLALMELDLRSGAMTAVPGGDSVVAYAAAPGGGIWIVRQAAPFAPFRADTLLLLDPATGMATVAGAFSSAASDLVDLAGTPVAVVGGGATIERLTGPSAWQDLSGFAGRVRRIAAAGGTRLVAAIEQATAAPRGAPADLWLLAFP